MAFGEIGLDRGRGLCSLQPKAVFFLEKTLTFLNAGISMDVQTRAD